MFGESTLSYINQPRENKKSNWKIGLVLGVVALALLIIGMSAFSKIPSSTSPTSSSLALQRRAYPGTYMNTTKHQILTTSTSQIFCEKNHSKNLIKNSKFYQVGSRDKIFKEFGNSCYFILQMSTVVMPISLNPQCYNYLIIQAWESIYQQSESQLQVVIPIQQVIAKCLKSLT